jgi:acetoin utilization deacetylase AcuC-like enzyme
VTLLYDDPVFLQHETGSHSENADRLRAVSARLRDSGLAARCARPDFEPCTRRRLNRIHSSHYIDEVWGLAKSGGGAFGFETLVGPSSFDVALLAAGSVCDAVERVVSGEDTRALCLVRPPGHHALTGSAMGFCLFNNVAVGASLAVEELRLDRVLIVDWDIHHGNGTQAAFWQDPRVGFLSIHRWPFYPGTGAAVETGGGPGLGATLNLPVAFGISRRDYLSLFMDQLERFASKIRPQLILVSAGFDTHRADPVGNLGLESEDFTALTRSVLEVARAHAGGRVVSVLEGGYDPAALSESVDLHLRELLTPA